MTPNKGPFYSEIQRLDSCFEATLGIHTRKSLLCVKGGTTLLCQPIIGVIIADGTVVEIGYYTVLADRMPQLQSVLDKFVDVLGYHDIVAGKSLLTRMSIKDKCSPPVTSFAEAEGVTND